MDIIKKNYEITEEDEKNLRCIIAVSKSGEIPFASMVIREGDILGIAVSGDIDSEYSLHDPTNHDSIMAIRDACEFIKSKDLSGATLYTSCEPCLMCAGAAREAKISRIVSAALISDRDEVLGEHSGISMEELNRRTGYKMATISGILREEALEVIKYWKKNNKSRMLKK